MPSAPLTPGGTSPAETSDRPLLQPIDQALFDRVAAEALASSRLRRNHNLHAEPDLVQRFLNVLQPGTYVRPHRHRRAIPGAGFECFVVLQGAIGLLLLDDSGMVLRLERLDAAGPLRGIELAEGQLHTLVALSPDAVMFEIKQGPYEPMADKDFMAAFPPEGTAAAAAQERAWRALFDHPCNDSAPSTPPVAPPVRCQG
jgi:cupin fold WbuC family metalloprotein